MFYNARYYDAYLNRWTQPDTIVTDWYNPQSLNRYAYTLNNPVKYADPTGHMESCGTEACGGGVQTSDDIYWYFADHAKKPWMAEGYRMVHEAEIAKAKNDPSAKDLHDRAEALLKDLSTRYKQDYTPSTWTLSMGVSYNIFVGAGYQGAFTVFNLDSHGRMQFFSLSSGFIGSTGIGMAVGPYAQVTNASDVSKLEGHSVNTGISAGEGTTGGVDWVINKDYNGIQANLGFGFKDSFYLIPGEYHGGYTGTQFLWRDIFWPGH